MQYHNNGWFPVLFTLIMVAFILVNIYRAKQKQGNLFVRKIPGLSAIEEAIGRATEMGRPVLMVPGIGDLNAISVQALNIFCYVAKVALKFATPIRVCCGNAAVYTVAQEMIRDVYQQEGAMDRFDAESVQFLSDRQFAFAAGVAGIIYREHAAATFFLGEFFAESLIFAESANSVGAIQVAGSTQTTQTPFFIAACDYVLIGDEYYAASAYLSRQPVLVGSLIGQDWCKISIAAVIFLGALINSFGSLGKTTTEIGEDGKEKPVTERLKGPDDIFIKQYFEPRKLTPDEVKALKPERQPDPEAPKEEAS